MQLLSYMRKLLNNPLGIFVYGILSKWYLMITITALVVTFWVFKGLEQAGVLQAAEQVVSKALGDTKSVAKYCVPKITNIREFWNCLENPPSYDSTPEEKQLEESVKQFLQKPSTDVSEPTKDPYAN